MSTESVRARLAAATPGPWNDGCWSDAHQFHYAETIATDDGSAVAGEVYKAEDRALIAHAPADLAAALAVIERVRGMILVARPMGDKFEIASQWIEVICTDLDAFEVLP